jgi:hypothetical protein
MDEIKAPAVAGPLKRATFAFDHWEYLVPDGEDYRLCATREYWLARNTERLRDGATIRVHSADHRVQFDVMVIHINQATNPITLELVFRPILPVNLLLPTPPVQRPARFEARELPGASGGFGVLDLHTGCHLRENPMRRADANELAASLQKAADAGEAEALAGLFATTVKDTQLSRRARGRPRKPARGAEAAAASLAAQGAGAEA